MKRLILTLAWFASTILVRAQGTVQFANGVTTRVQLFDVQTGTTSAVPTSTSLNYGLFVNGSTTPVLPLGASSPSNAGIITATSGGQYPIPGTTPYQTVALQVRGWAAEFGGDWQAARAAGGIYGETDVRQIELSFFPGTVIWQSSTGTNANRFNPLVVSGGGIVIPNITVAEGSNGVVNAVFTVRLSSPSESQVTVDFATLNGSAVAGQDYVPKSGTVTFAPGETSQTVSVELTADAPPEPDEQFSLVLSNPVNSAIRKGTGICLITEARINEVRIDTAIVIHTVLGRRYVVEKTTDLVTWDAVPGAEEVPGIGGPITVYDKGVGCAGGLRYYRTRLLDR